MPGTMPTVETVRWRADSPRSPCSRSTAPHTAVVVGERLAHPHEHDVADPAAAVAGPPGGPHDLLDDLAGGEVAREPGLAGGAEAAAHRAPGLARDAHRGAVGVQHQHGLDAGAAVERPQALDRVAARR